MFHQFYNKGVALRCSSKSSILDDDISFEVIGVDIDAAIIMNSSCMVIQTFIGVPGQKDSI